MAAKNNSQAQALAIKMSELHKQKAALIAEKEKLALIQNEVRALKSVRK